MVAEKYVINERQVGVMLSSLGLNESLRWYNQTDMQNRPLLMHIKVTNLKKIKEFRIVKFLIVSALALWWFLLHI